MQYGAKRSKALFCLTSHWRAFVGLLGLLLPCSALAADAQPDPQVIEFFEQRIRPILVERCQSCHGAKQQWAELRLDSRAALLKGGDSGPAIVAGEPDSSELLRRVIEPDPSLRMPPENKGRPLSRDEIDAFRHWIKTGAVWPDSPTKPADSIADAATKHWAFQPVREITPPVVANDEWSRTPIDRFILERLAAAGLKPSPEADRPTLLRRVTYDLTGLPPTAEEVDAFVRDDAPDAWERLVDRLLASPRYGERWGRHWLDVARYSDTKGYVYAREESRFVHASVYRDWVIAAFNRNLPYDRFLLLQLAADKASPDSPQDLAAMGYLTLGRRFIGVTPDIIDDRIDVTCRGLMALTVGCARCHDHKYDPIPTADYYSLYGVFQNCVERIVPIPGDHPAPSEEFAKGLEERRKNLADGTAEARQSTGDHVRSRIADYLHAQWELDKYPELGFDVIVGDNDLIPGLVRRWQAFLATAAKENDPVFVPWTAYATLDAATFAEHAGEVTRQLHSEDFPASHPRIAAAFREPPTSPRDVADRYAAIFHDVDRVWKELLAAEEKAGRPQPTALPNAADEALRQVLYGRRSPCVIPDEPIVNTEWYYNSNTHNRLWKLQVELDRWLLPAPRTAPHMVVLTDREETVTPRIFRRGNPATKGEEVPRRFLELLSGDERQPFTDGSGRLELAKAIASADNPLTARVWVNRVWSHHFGEGLVRTPSDFGLRAEPPSHPELLDWLTSEFTSNGWNTKDLHRAILLSAAYRQSATASSEQETQQASLIDPENRLLWRMNPRRLEFEELRDTLVALSGELDRAIGGAPVDLFPGGKSYRRSVYGMIDRQFVPGVLRVFDFANPDLHTPERSETTVPQQALFFLNHAFVAGRSRAIADRIESSPGSSPEDRIRELYRIVLQREPTSSQRAAALAFIASAENEPASAVPVTAADWSYGYGEVDPQTRLLKSFEPLPHFTGAAWQGGEKWPDAKLGWAQLTAEGGHPGNDLAHACVRRWTAPRAGTVSIKSVVTHAVAAGDGIRCSVLSSRRGLLVGAVIHNRKQSLDVNALEVEAGETLDFVTDIHQNLNSDQFLWSADLQLAASDEATAASLPTDWNSNRDFLGPQTPPLSPWAQLAQVLLMSNEVSFVD